MWIASEPKVGLAYTYWSDWQIDSRVREDDFLVRPKTLVL